MKPPRILVVEDDELIRELASDAFKDEGFEVLEASTGDEGARLLADPDSIDVIFTDVQMPGVMDGINLAIHARGLHPRIIVIVASGYAPLLRPRLNAMEPPPPFFFRKPYRTADVIAEVRRLLT